MQALQVLLIVVKSFIISCFCFKPKFDILCSGTISTYHEQCYFHLKICIKLGYVLTSGQKNLKSYLLIYFCCFYLPVFYQGWPEAGLCVSASHPSFFFFLLKNILCFCSSQLLPVIYFTINQFAGNTWNPGSVGNIEI